MNSRSLRQNSIFDYALLSILFIAIPVLYLLFISPLSKTFDKLADKNMNLEQELATIRSDFKHPISTELNIAQYINVKLKQNWKKIKEDVQLIDTLAEDETFRSVNEDAIIDYKITLFNTDLMLREEASSYKTILPDNIGMPEEVEEGQNIEILFDQLAIISKLIRLIMRSGIQEINNIRCQQPLTHPLIEEEHAIVTEYPIRINIITSYGSLLNLLMNFNNKGTFFAVSEIEVLKADKYNKDVLNVELLCSAYGFNERVEDDDFINNEDVDTFINKIESRPSGRRGYRGRSRDQ